jgi:phage gp36-like protein
MYSTITNIREITPYKDETLISGVYIESKIEEADNIIDSIVSATYVIPLSETPKIIKNISKALTACLLYREQSTNIEGQGVDVEAWFTQQMDLLEQIRKRKLKLLDSDGNELKVQKRCKFSYYPTSDVDRMITFNEKF